MDDESFNPLDKINLAESIQRRLLQSPRIPLYDLPGPKQFRGAGVYCLYYCGSFGPYSSISKYNLLNEIGLPIYVGKAIPPGGRIGGFRSNLSSRSPIRNRLKRHSDSIKEVNNIEVPDFEYRSLVVDDVWIPLGENMLIETFKPLWNLVVPGFGNNPTGGPRSGQSVSFWDILHPGRPGAGVGPKGRLEDIVERIQTYCSEHPSLV